MAPVGPSICRRSAGRRSVPAGIEMGRRFPLEGQGQQSAYGGRGALILTIAIAPAESQGSQPFPNPGTDFPTEMSTGAATTAGRVVSPIITSNTAAWRIYQLSRTRQRPSNADPTVPSYAQTPLSCTQ